jgi:hypothetical protein
MATIEELEKRIQYLEDVEAIKSLKYKYAKACDEHNAELFREVFTEDVVWDGGPKYGRRTLAAMIERVASGRGQYDSGLHYFTNPEITINGNMASARWLLWRASTTVSWVLGKGPTNEANSRVVWLVGWENDKYVKIDGKWKQNEMVLTLVFQVQTPYEEG